MQKLDFLIYFKTETRLSAIKSNQYCLIESCVFGRHWKDMKSNFVMVLHASGRPVDHFSTQSIGRSYLVLALTVIGWSEVTIVKLWPLAIDLVCSPEMQWCWPEAVLFSYKCLKLFEDFAAWFLWICMPSNSLMVVKKSRAIPFSPEKHACLVD